MSSSDFGSSRFEASDFGSNRIDSDRSERGPRDSSASEMLTLSQSVDCFLNMPVIPLIGMVALFLAAFGNLVNVALDKDVVAIDKQVIVKLAVLALGGLYGAYGFITEPRVRRLMFSPPTMWIVVIFGFYLLAVPGSSTQTESLASTLSIACVLLMSLTCLVHHGTQFVLNTIFWAISLFVILSWAVYFLVPAIGVFEEPIADGQFTVRMSGLAHPNTLGQFSGILMVLGCILHQNYKLISWLRVACVLLAFGALIGSLSRTSLLATVLALGVVYRQHFLQRKFTLYFVGLALLGIVGLMVMSINHDIVGFVQSKLTFLSKSGDTEELTSATGRADIWSYAIHLISERPLTGYGAATSKYYLTDYSLYTHNMILNVAFSTGVFGGLAVVLMTLGRVRDLFTRRHAIVDGLVAFILLNGLFENVMFSILAGMPTILWIVAITIPGYESTKDDHPETLTVRNGAALRGRSR